MVTACVRTESFSCFLNQEIFAQQIAHVQVPAIRNAVPVSLQYDICGSNSITYATSRTIPPPTLQFSRSGTTSKHGRAYFSGSLKLCLSLRVQQRWNKSRILHCATVIRIGLINQSVCVLPGLHLAVLEVPAAVSWR